MPSRLATTTARYGSGIGQLRAKANAVAAAISQGRQTLQIRGPWSGYLPDIDPNLVDGTQLARVQNVLARAYKDHGEVLGLPDGYRQIDSARLPLGDGSTLPAAPVTDADPVL